MIDPAGHSKDTGRKLHHGYERAETYKWAEALKGDLEKRYSDVRVVLTRAPGDEIVPLQNASFANRLKVDLFIRLQLYKEESEKPKLYLYHHVVDPLVDGTKKPTSPFAFVPVSQAHYAALKRTENYGTQLYRGLTKSGFTKQFDCHTPRGIPLKPMVGIQAPSLVLELGVHKDDHWSVTIEPFLQGIAPFLS